MGEGSETNLLIGQGAQLASELTPRTRFREGPQGREWDMVKGRSRCPARLVQSWEPREVRGYWRPTVHTLEYQWSGPESYQRRVTQGQQVLPNKQPQETRPQSQDCASALGVRATDWGLCVVLGMLGRGIQTMK